MGGLFALVIGVLAVWVLPAWILSLKRRIELLEESRASARTDDRLVNTLITRVAALEAELRDRPTTAPLPVMKPPVVVPPPPVVAPPPVVTPPIARVPPPVVTAPIVVPPVAAPARPAPPAPPATKWINWESLVGVQLFSAIAGIALLIAAVFFLKFSMEQGWLQPPVRAAIGVIVSVGLLIACELKAARRYPATANALDASAIAILFSTTFASHALWHLIPGSVAFGLLALVTVVAVLLSIRRNSLFIALLGLLGGFATPILLSTGDNRPVQLFSYLLLLNVGLAWVAQRRRWPVLTWVSLALTALYQWGWVLRFLDLRSIPLAMGIFLTFPIAALASLRLKAASADGDSGDHFRNAARFSSLMPAAFGMYLIAVPAYAASPALLFGFVLLVDAGLFAISLGLRDERLHMAGAVTTLMAVGIWLSGGYLLAPQWRLALGFSAAFVVFYLAAVPLAARLRRPFGMIGRATTYVAPLLLAGFVLLAVDSLAGAYPWLLFGTLFSLLLLIGWRAIADRQGALYHLSAVVAVAVQAIWSTTHLIDARLGTAVAIYSVFGVIAMAIPLAARRTTRPLQPEWGGGVALLASLALLFFISLGFTSASALWALALLLAIMNAALFVESAGSRFPLVAHAATLMSWGILATWWSRSAGVVGVIPSLAVITGLSLATLTGYVLANGAAPADSVNPSETFSSGTYLALIGQLFLLWMATNRAWALPPWPMFGSLVVMTLAASAAALYMRQVSLHAAATIGASIVILVWSTIAGGQPYASIAIAATAAVSAYALVWARAARGSASVGAVAVALAVSVFATTIAVLQPGGPPFGIVLAAQLAFFTALLIVAWRSQWEWLAVVAAGLVLIAEVPWLWAFRPARSWSELLIISSTLYALFVAYPLVLGRRAAKARGPFIAAVAATVIFVLNGREAFLAGPWQSIVGVVPLIACGVLALLLQQLLQIQPPAERDLGRLAVVAGAALACVTVAIPMQLERQWITVGWALEGAALAWLHRRIAHRGLLLASASLLAVVFARLTMNPEILAYAPRGAMPILNWYLYTYGVASAALLAAGRWFSNRDLAIDSALRPSRWMPAAAVVLLFLLLNIEIADYFASGPRLTFQFGVSVAQDLTYTIGWLLFGMVLLVSGITAPSRPARITAVALIAITTCKCFLYDLSSLEGLYRVGSFVGLAVALALVALTIQKYVIARPGPSTP